MNVLSLFDGISCGRLALDRANIKYDRYYSSEIDKHAIDVATRNYPDTIQIGDIKKNQYIICTKNRFNYWRISLSII